MSGDWLALGAMGLLAAAGAARRGSRSDSSTENGLLLYIEKAKKIFGGDRLSGGNCGTFALALQAICEDNDASCVLAFLGKNRGVDAESFREWGESEPDVYHVVTIKDGVMYDGTGRTDADELLSLAEDQYDDLDPVFWTMEPTDQDDRISSFVVRNETSWDISASRFYQAMAQ